MARNLAPLSFAAAAVAAISAGVSEARAAGVAVRIEPGYTATTTHTTAEGIATESESALVTQKYGLTVDQSPWPLLRLSLGGLLDWSFGTVTSPAQTADVDTKRWSGYGRFDAGGPFARVGAGYDRREDWSRTETSATTASARLVHDSLTAYALLKPEGLPAIDLRAIRSRSFDVDRVVADQSTDEVALGLRYEPAPPVELRYSLRVTNPRDELRGTDTVSTANFGRATYQESLLAGRASLFVSYELSRIDSTTRVSGPGGTVQTQQFPVRGLSGIETFPAVPERITLEANPALIDGNVAATAGIDIGYRAAGGLAPPARELGVQFADSVTPVSEIHVWVDRRIPQDVAAAFAWSAWRSADNVEWQRVDPVGAVRFDLFDDKFVIPIPQTSARYLKVVVSPLPQTVTTDPQLATILVTEVQTFLAEPAQARKGSSSLTRGTFNGGARYLFRTVPGLSYDFMSYVRHGQDLSRDVVWSLTNGLAYTRRTGRTTTLNARVDRTDLDETRGHEASSGYALSLSTTPLPTLSASLGVNGGYQQRVDADEWRNTILAGTSAELYQGVNVGANGSLTYGESSTGRKIRAADGRATATLVPHRTLSLSGTFAATESRTSGAGVPAVTDSIARIEGTASYTPFPALFLSASHTRYVWGRLSPESLSSFGGTVSPFPGGALLVRFTYQETIDTTQELRTRSWGPGLRWTIKPRWFLDVTYTRNTSRSPALENRMDAFYANMLAIIG